MLDATRALGAIKSLAHRVRRRPPDTLKDLGARAFFVFGCARSGTTSLCRILDLADNGACLLEPNPNLNVESRHRLDGRLDDPDAVLADILLPRMRKELRRHEIYGEKNVTLTAFIGELHRLLGSKLIWITRDGREVAASLHNWHNRLFGTIYRECKDPGNLSEIAKAALGQLPIEEDTSDYSRPRPRPGDPYYDRWLDLSRHEMLCWYWAFINNYALDQLRQVPEDCWIRVDYSAKDRGAEVCKAVDFLGLRGISRDAVEEMLNRRINSLADRTGTVERIPSWQDWSDRELDQFWEIGGATMERLGYFRPRTPVERRYTPRYGDWWRSSNADHGFFQKIYQGRLAQHQAFMAWVEPHKHNKKIRSVCEVACGHGIGYADFFADCSYTGVDISEKVINWCRENRKNPLHQWLCLDFIRQPPNERFDLVFCQGSIENVYDMDALIRRMAECSDRYLYVTAFEGYFPELEEHVYLWSPSNECYTSQLSPSRTEELLRTLGFAHVEVSAQPTGRQDIPFETVIIASRERK